MNEGLQAVVDCLIDERCHACGARINGATPLDPVSIRIGPLALTTRLLCEGCVARMEVVAEPVWLGAPVCDSALAVYPAFVTDNAVLAVVHLLKFERRERVAAWIARLMRDPLARALESGLEAPVLVPVPMDRAAQRRRGFNQAERIARVLGARRFEVAPRALRKVRATTPQSSLDRAERLRNLEGAIAAGSERVAGRHVVLVDDLVTTGATVGACAGIVRARGAAKVSVVCFGYRP